MTKRKLNEVVETIVSKIKEKCSPSDADIFQVEIFGNQVEYSIQDYLYENEDVVDLINEILVELSYDAFVDFTIDNINLKNDFAHIYQSVGKIKFRLY